MKKLIHTLVLSLALLTVLRIEAQSIHYTYEKDDPFDVKNFSASIDPLFVDFNGNNGAAFGWGIRGEYMMGKRLLADFGTRIGFGTTGYKKSNTNTKNYFAMEAGLGLILSNRARVKNVPIILSQSTSGNTRTTVYIKGGVPAKCRLIFALRGGFTQYNNTLKYSGINDSLLRFEHGGASTTYGHAKKDDSSIFRDTVGGKAIDQLGGITMVSIYGGLQFRTIRQLILDVDGYGTRSNIRYSDFYIDVLFAPVIKIRDFRSNNMNYNVSYEKLSHVGWRVGWFWRHPKEQGFSAKFEFGSRPGFKAEANKNIPVNTKNLYGMLTFGLDIPLNIKPVYTGED